MPSCCVQIGLEMLISHPGNDPSTWAITQIFYNGQVYQNTTQLNTAFADTTSGLNRQQVMAASLILPSWFSSSLQRTALGKAKRDPVSVS